MKAFCWCGRSSAKAKNIVKDCCVLSCHGGWPRDPQTFKQGRVSHEESFSCSTLTLNRPTSWKSKVIRSWMDDKQLHTSKGFLFCCHTFTLSFKQKRVSVSGNVREKRGPFFQLCLFVCLSLLVAEVVSGNMRWG